MDVVAIYNNALGKVGTRTTVSATTEGSNEANACNVFYEQSRDATLRLAFWNFARKQKLLTQLKSSKDVPNTCPTPWGFEYAYPVDCLRARFILPQTAVQQVTVDGVPIDSAGVSTAPTTLMGPPVKFLVGMDEDGSGNPIRVILTNQYQAQLVYTAKIVDPNLYDPEFVEALAMVLASNISLNITGDKNLKAQLYNQAKDFIATAQAVNASEGQEVQNPIPDWMRARGMGSNLPPGFGDMFV